jgi:LPXTG-motif cell wall-anchored protein
MRKVLLAACGATGWLVLLSAPAAAQQSLPSIVISQTIRDAPGSVHVVSTTNVDPSIDGGTCDVTVTGENNASVHPNSDILVASANQVTVPDVERAAGAEGIPADGTLELGSTVTISVRLGGDGVFSGGLLEVDFTCTPPTPPPTPPPSVTPQQVVTTTAVPNVPVVAGESQQPPTAGQTLPRTGTDNTGPFVVGIASLLAGVALLAKASFGTRRARASGAGDS